MKGIQDENDKLTMGVKIETTGNGKGIAQEALKSQWSRQLRTETTGNPDEEIMGELSQQEQDFLGKKGVGIGMMETEGLLVEAVEGFEGTTTLVIGISELEQDRITGQGKIRWGELSQEGRRCIGDENTIMNGLVGG